MAFETVFKITDQPYPFFLIFFSYIGYPMLVIGLISLGVSVARRHKNAAITGTLLLIFGLIFCLVSRNLKAEFRDPIDHIVAAYKQGKSEMVEGRVVVLRKQPSGGHAPGDLIKIQDKEFVIDSFSFKPGYQKTVAQGGILQDGEYVRVCSVDGAIVQIDKPVRGDKSH